MKKLFLAATVLVGAASASQAGGINLKLGIHLPLPPLPFPVVVSHRAAVYPPAPVVYTPAPVCEPAPICAPPVVYTPPVCAPGVVIESSVCAPRVVERCDPPRVYRRDYDDHRRYSSREHYESHGGDRRDGWRR